MRRWDKGVEKDSPWTRQHVVRAFLNEAPVPLEVALKYPDVVAQNLALAHLELCRTEYFSEWCQNVKDITNPATITYHLLCKKTGYFNEWYSTTIRPIFDAAAQYRLAHSGK